MREDRRISVIGCFRVCVGTRESLQVVARQSEEGSDCHPKSAKRVRPACRRQGSAFLACARENPGARSNSAPFYPKARQRRGRMGGATLCCVCRGAAITKENLLISRSL